MSVLMIECEGCGQELPYNDAGVIWCDAPLGHTVLKTHKTQECGRAALAKHPGYKMLPGNRPQQGRSSRLAREGL
jgi:hypothetical protein